MFSPYSSTSSFFNGLWSPASSIINRLPSPSATKHINRKFIALSLILILVLLPSCTKNQTVPAYKPTPLQQNTATKQLLHTIYNEWNGVPHRDGGLSKKGVDCSGFVYLVFKDKLHKTVPRTTTELASAGKQIPQNRLQAGDIILFKIRYNVKHVGIYIGNRQFIHVSKSNGVQKSELGLQYWQNHYWQSRRLLQ